MPKIYVGKNKTSTSSIASALFNAVDLRDGWGGRGKAPLRLRAETEPCARDREKKLGQDLESDIAFQLGMRTRYTWTMPPLPISLTIS